MESKEEYDKLPEIAKNVIEASGIPLTMSASFPEEEFSVVTATIDESQNAAAEIIRSWRWDWGDKHGSWILKFNATFITPKTAVFVAIGEGAPGGPEAGKVLGSTTYTLLNVAPRNGGVNIQIKIDLDSNLRLYVDYLAVSIDVFGHV
jgi:hypothetical protein